MNNRIKRFMEHRGLSPSELADTIGVQRSNITHVLQGRNKPGFQFINKMLETFPELNAKWLLTGEGEMLMNGDEHVRTGEKPVDLFSGLPRNSDSPEQTAGHVPPVNPPMNDDAVRERKIAPESQAGTSAQPMPEILGPFLSGDHRKIESIVVFYSDQTFRQYIPSK